MVYWIIIMLTFFLDQLTKAKAENVFVENTVNLLGGILSLTYVQNRGGAFSILEGKRRFFIIVSIILILFLCYMIFKSTSNLYRFSFSLIVGGAIGNLFDRIAKGYVVDFIDIKVIPVFNLADFFITCGVLLLIFLMLKEGGEELFLKKKP